MSTKSVTSSTTTKAPAKAPTKALVKAPQKPKAPTQPKQSQSPQAQGNWISQNVQGWVANIGSAVGGGVNAVGTGVSHAGRGIGDSVTNSTRGWADVVRSYGNAIKDATGASGTRAVTGSNPLGLGGQRGVWAPSAQRVGQGQRNAGGGTASNPLGLK